MWAKDESKQKFDYLALMLGTSDLRMINGFQGFSLAKETAILWPFIWVMPLVEFIGLKVLSSVQV